MAKKTINNVEESPDLETGEIEYDIAYHKSVKWDSEKGDFVLNDACRMVICNGQEAYKTWCTKVAMTERYQCLAYPDEIGTELEEAKQEEDRKAVELAIERTITEAISTNPRTENVSDFSFVWKEENIYCNFTVKAINNEDAFSITI